MLADIGYGSLWLTLAAALWAMGAALAGARQRRPELLASARNALLATAALSTLAAAALLALLGGHHFEVRYVYEHVSSYLKPAYILAAFWAGLEGSQLLWLWLLALVTAAVALRRRGPEAESELRPYALGVLALAQAFFALLLVQVSNPFALMPTIPLEGVSLNPLLQNFWMIVHPPIIFAAYALWTVPFAYAIAALIAGRLDAGWLQASRRWTLAAWAALGIGILVGAWWAYLELGWGGYWGWDPVENSSFIPWLVGTAFVHAAILQERRDMFRAWTVLLAGLTFALTLFATFVTRSGLIQSVHAFAESPIGWYYLGFIGLALAGTLGLALARRAELQGSGQLGELLSREFAFLVTNLLFLGSAAAVLLGTLWPTFTEAVRGVAGSLGPENYNRFMGPLGLMLVLLIGLCPLLDWRQMSPGRLLHSLWIQAAVGAASAVLLILFRVREAWAVVSFAVTAFVGATVLLQLLRGIAARLRSAGEKPWIAVGRAVAHNRRRYGGQLVHLSMLLIVMGITGSQAYQQEVQVALAVGEEVQISTYTLAYRDYTYRQIEEEGNKLRNQAVVDVYRGGRQIATVRPERNLHSNVQGAVSEIALRSNLKEDLYVVLASLEADGLAAFQVLINPLVVWLWIGGGLLLIGVLIAAWPGRKP